MADELTPTIAERAVYIHEMCIELYRLASPPRLRALSYLIDMVRLEAERVVKDEREARDRSPG